MKYWIISITEENWYVVKENNIYGVPEPSKGIRDLIGLGDTLIFHVIKRRSKKLGGKFVGVFKTASTWFREEKPLWPDEVREGEVKYPWRIRLEPVKLGTVALRELVPELTFIENKKNPGIYLMGTPANFKRPIPENDAKRIIEKLK